MLQQVGSVIKQPDINARILVRIIVFKVGPNTDEKSGQRYQRQQPENKIHPPGKENGDKGQQDKLRHRKINQVLGGTLFLTLQQYRWVFAAQECIDIEKQVGTQQFADK